MSGATPSFCTKHPLTNMTCQPNLRTKACFLINTYDTSQISELVHGKRPISADTALCLGLFFGMEPRCGLNLQTEYDMRMAVRTLHDKVAPRIRTFQPRND